MWQRLRWWRMADEMAADFATKYPAQSDAEFLAECGLADAPVAALAVRRSVATYGMVAPDHIRSGHGCPGALMELSGWDSLDFLEWVFELERELGPGARVERSWFDGLSSPVTVRDLAWAVHRRWPPGQPQDTEPGATPRGGST